MLRLWAREVRPRRSTQTNVAGLRRGLQKQQKLTKGAKVARLPRDSNGSRRVLCSLERNGVDKHGPEQRRDTKHERDGGAVEIGYRPQDVKGIVDRELAALCIREGVDAAWADVSHAALGPTLVRQARDAEMKYVAGMSVCPHVHTSDQVRTGGKVVRVQWADTNKGDAAKPNYRSRLVGQEFKTEVDNSLYTGAPPV